jgi:hypothetical protein
MFFSISREFVFHQQEYQWCFARDRNEKNSSRCEVYAPFRGFLESHADWLRRTAPFSVSMTFEKSFTNDIQSHDGNLVEAAQGSVIARAPPQQREVRRVKCIGTIYAPGLTSFRHVTHGHPAQHRFP